MTTEGADHPVSRDREVLEFIYNRLVDVYGEKPNVDYMIHFRRIVDTYKPRPTLERKIDDTFAAVAKTHLLVLAQLALDHGESLDHELIASISKMVDEMEPL